MGCGLWVVGCGLWVVGCRLWVVGCGLWVVGCRLWVVGCGLWVVGCGLWVGRLWCLFGVTAVARSAFEKLRVYGLSEELADCIWELVAKWDVFAKRTIGEQLVDAADSIGANIAEGYGRGSHKDNRRFVIISRGSLNETQHFLRRAYRRGLLSDEQVARLKLLLDELAPKLNNYLKSIGPRPTPANPDN